MNETAFINSWLEYLGSHAETLGIGLQHTFLGHALWQYVAYFVWLGVGFFVGVRLIAVLDAIFARFLTKQHEHFSAKLVEKLFFPLKAAFGVILVIGGLRVFQLARENLALEEQVLVISLGVCGTLAMLRVVEVFLWRWRVRYKLRHNENLNNQLFTMIEQAIKFFIIVTFSITTLHNMGVNINSLLASLSIGSLAVALAAQDTLANLFGAVSILADNTFKIGDTIQVEGNEGTVELIGLRSTRIRNKEGHVVIIPNKSIGTSVITNITQRKSRKTLIQFHIEHDKTTASDMEKACSLLKEIYEGDLSTESVQVYFLKISPTALLIEVAHWSRCSTENIYYQSMHQFNLKIKEVFDREGLNFVYPSPTVFIEKKQ